MSLTVVRVYDVLSELNSSGALKVLVRSGAFTPTVFLYLQIVDEMKRTPWKRKLVSKTEYYYQIADKFNTSFSTVYRAQAMMGKIVHTFE